MASVATTASLIGEATATSASLGGYTRVSVREKLESNGKATVPLLQRLVNVRRVRVAKDDRRFTAQRKVKQSLAKVA